MKSRGGSSALAADKSSAKQIYLRTTVTGVGDFTVLSASLRLRVDNTSAAASVSGGRIHSISDC